MSEIRRYEDYHAKVVQACVDLMTGQCTNDDGSKMTDDEIRQFFGDVCSYHDEFADNQTPEEVAEGQWEAITS